MKSVSPGAVRSRRYRQRHPERARDATKRWTVKNRKKRIIYGRYYYAKHRKRRIREARQWYIKNDARAKETRRKYVKKNKEKLALLRRKWRVKHKEQDRATDRRRRQRDPLEYKIKQQRSHAKRSRSIPGSFSINDVKEHIKYQNGRCYYCWKKLSKSFHIDHLVPVGRGGSNRAENIRPTCATCNVSKHTSSVMDFCLRLLS